MPEYFAHEATPRDVKGKAATFQYQGKKYVATPPTRFPVSARPYVYDTIQMIYNYFIWMFIIILTYPKGTIMSTKEYGWIPRPVAHPSPFVTPGLAFSIARGKTIPDDDQDILHGRDFYSVSYSGQEIWVKNTATIDDYQYVKNNIDEIVWNTQCPSQYLNMKAFRGYLFLMRVTNAITQFTRHMYVGEEITQVGGWGGDSTKTLEEADDDQNIADSSGVDITKLETIKATALTAGQKAFQQALIRFGIPDYGYYREEVSWAGMRVISPGINAASFSTYSGFTARSHGLLLKFEAPLAVSETSPINRVLERLLPLFGQDHEEQNEFLQLSMNAVGALKLTRMGDELTHLYRCIDLAIAGSSGLVPLFTGNSYEGCVIGGGAGAYLHLGLRIVPFMSQAALVQDMVNASTHLTNMNLIISLVSDVTKHEAIRATTSMVQLRAIILDLPFSAEDSHKVESYASCLTFAHPPLTVQPANIDKILGYITNPTLLDDTFPIGSASIFSKDHVLVALSCFGTRVPSWRIPGGALQRINTTPPTAPGVAASLKGKGKAPGASGNDAAWTMVVRKTSLVDAVVDMKECIREGGWRSIVSRAARSQGFLAWDSKQMMRFWSNLKSAYEKVDPSFDVGVGTTGAAKRKMGNTPPPAPGATKKRKTKLDI